MYQLLRGETGFANGILSVVTESVAMTASSFSTPRTISKQSQCPPPWKPSSPDVHLDQSASTTNPVRPLFGGQLAALHPSIPSVGSQQVQAQATVAEGLSNLKVEVSAASEKATASVTASSNKSSMLLCDAFKELNAKPTSSADVRDCPSSAALVSEWVGRSALPPVLVQEMATSSRLGLSVLSSHSSLLASSTLSPGSPLSTTPHRGYLFAPHSTSPCSDYGSLSPRLTAAGTLDECLHKPCQCGSQRVIETTAARPLKSSLFEAGGLAVIVGFHPPPGECSPSARPIPIPSPATQCGADVLFLAPPNSPTANLGSPRVSLQARLSSRQRGLSASLSDSRSHSSSPRGTSLHPSSLDLQHLGGRQQGDISSPRTNSGSSQSSLSSTPNSSLYQGPVSSDGGGALSKALSMVMDEERGMAGAVSKESEKRARRRKPGSPFTHMLTGVGLASSRENDGSEHTRGPKAQSLHVIPVAGMNAKNGSFEGLSQRCLGGHANGRKMVGMALAIEMANTDSPVQGEGADGGGIEGMPLVEAGPRASFSRPGSPSTPPMAIPKPRGQHRPPAASHLTSPPVLHSAHNMSITMHRSPKSIRGQEASSADKCGGFAISSGDGQHCISAATAGATLPSSSSSPLLSPFTSPVRTSGGPSFTPLWPRPAQSPPLSRSPLGPRFFPEASDCVRLLDTGSAHAAYSPGQVANTTPDCCAPPQDALALSGAEIDTVHSSSPQPVTYSLSHCPPASQTYRVFSASPPPPPFMMGLSPPGWSASLLNGMNEPCAGTGEASMSASSNGNSFSAVGEPHPGGSSEAMMISNSRPPCSGPEFEACSAPSLGWGPKIRGSGALKIARPLVGSFEECLLSGRMFSTNTPQRLEGFMALLSVTGKWNVRQQKLPFSVVSIESNNLLLYTATIDLGNSCSTSSAGSTSTMARRATKDVLAKNRHRVPMKGRVQLVLSNPEKTPVHTFVCKYDLTEMRAGSKTFVRQRIVVANCSTTGMMVSQGMKAGTRGDGDGHGREHSYSCRGETRYGGTVYTGDGALSMAEGNVMEGRGSLIERESITGSCSALRRLSYPGIGMGTSSYCFGMKNDEQCVDKEICRSIRPGGHGYKDCCTEENKQLCIGNGSAPSKNIGKSLQGMERMSKDEHRIQGATGLGSGALRYALHIRFICCPTKGASDTESLKYRGSRRSRSLGSQNLRFPREGGSTEEEVGSSVGAEDDDALGAKRSRSIEGLNFHKTDPIERSPSSVKQSDGEVTDMGAWEQGLCKRNTEEGEEGGRKFYMYGDLRVIFPQRRSDDEGNLQVVYDYPSNPKYFSY